MAARASYGSAYGLTTRPFFHGFEGYGRTDFGFRTFGDPYGFYGVPSFAIPLPIGTYRVSSAFGFRTHPVTGQKEKFHNGVDLAAPTGTPVYTIATGKVTFAGMDSRGINGNWIKVDHGDGYSSAYLHLSAINVAVGQTVAAGTRLGAVGATGRVTGPHLHFILYQNGTEVDPMLYLAKQGVAAAVSTYVYTVPRMVLWGSVAMAGVILVAEVARRRRR
jgi:murein DD-endopeptidase MepM/ murein hydrolase activator NlpD